jgi:hypothetical protein
MKRGTKVFIHGSVATFSFMNWIFLQNESINHEIFEHESAHVLQFHLLDLIIMEAASIALWFNPIMIFYYRSLKQQHEYLADRLVIDKNVSVENYLRLIGQHIESTANNHLVSSFHFQSVKKRINMITSRRTSVYWSGLYCITLPIIFCLLVAFSPRKSFLIKSPLESDSTQSETSFALPIDKKENARLESGFGERMHPVLGTKRMHTGIDLVAEGGVPVLSVEEGEVLVSHFAEGWGNIIMVQHDNTYSTSYSHLKTMNVKKGDKVSKGQIIGLVGNTGLATKNHLHFEIHKNGEAIDPVNYLPDLK